MKTTGGLIEKPSTPTYWVAYSSDGVRHTGITQTNQVTVSGQPLWIQGTSELALVEAANKASFTNWATLPAEGKEVQKGIYSCDDKTIIVKEDFKRLPALDIVKTTSTCTVLEKPVIEEPILTKEK